MNYRDKLVELGIDVYKIRGKQGKILCPKCSHTRKKKTDPCLSVNTEEGWYKCHNCEWQGNVRFDEKTQRQKNYVRPKLTNQTECDNGAVSWFAGRGINQMTLIKNKVMSGVSWMPQTQKDEYTVQFTYWQNNNLINIKHRDINKNFRLEKDAELIFYGLDDLKDDHKYILIAEGEICKLSWNEAGVDFALSVPNGASKQKNDGKPIDLEYLDNCWEYFDNNKIVILATDNDTPGILLREELSRRIGRERCRKIDFKDQKDANDYLVNYGPEALKNLVSEENLIEYPLQGIVEIDDIWDDVEVLMKEGLQRGLTTDVFKEFDNHMSFEGSKLCVVTGLPNSGKSPFVDICMIILSIKYGWKWGICSMENKPLKLYIVKLAEKIYGQLIRPNKPLPDDKKHMIRNFIRDHFYFIEANFDNGESETLDFILESAASLVRKHGIKGLTIDPWNKIEHQMKNGENETNYVSRTLDRLIRFEQNHDLFTFLVAHPAKMKKTKGGEYEVPDLYNISGSAHFYNKVDFGITVHRNYKAECTEIHITKMKWDHLGKKGAIAFKYNGGNGRLYEQIGGRIDFSFWLESLLMESNYKKSESEMELDAYVINGQEIEDAPF